MRLKKASTIFPPALVLPTEKKVAGMRGRRGIACQGSVGTKHESTVRIVHAGTYGFISSVSVSLCITLPSRVDKLVSCWTKYQGGGGSIVRKRLDQPMFP